MMQMDFGLSVSVDVNNCSGLSTYKFDVNKLGNDVSEFLNIEDDNKNGVSGSEPPYGKYKFPKKNGTTEKCFSNNTTFPYSSKTTSSEAASTEVASDTHDINVSKSTPCSHTSSMPTTLKPVSAMKGSREKRGITPPQKLTVKWAPDVYDPIPTSVSHSVTNHKPKKHSKKNSKSKQKNASKSSRGNKYKDKKQTRKRGGNSSNTGYKLPEHEEDEVVDYCEAPPTAMDFHVGNSDQFCGSSFLKRYDSDLHVSSLAEAT